MNPPCAKCKKIVYPVEKLSCLDKTWHKACFRCQVCDLKLNMKTYKGYDKLPYCVVHYPVTKFTQVADTPEGQRLAKQQKNQSSLEYKKDQSAALKGFTAVSDSVALRQATQANRLASNIGYQTAPHSVGQEGRPLPENIVNRQPPQQQLQQQQQQQQAFQPVQHVPAQPVATQPPPPQAAPPPARAPSVPTYVALYDYTAADDDEISFNEGDKITDVTVIDEGWMEGRNVRTNQYGMLPSNYVEQR